MREKTMIDFLLSKELEINSRFNSAISEILRHGLEGETGRKQTNCLVDSVRYIVDDIERFSGV